MMSFLRWNKQNSVPPDNTVDKDMQSMLLPFSFMQIFLLGPKFRIKNDAITQNDVLCKVVLLCGTMFEYIYRVLHNSDVKAQEYIFIEIQDIGTYTDFSFNFFRLFMNFVVNLLQSKKYVNFDHSKSS